MQKHRGQKISPKLSDATMLLFLGQLLYIKGWGYLPWCWHQACHKLCGWPSCASVFPSHKVQFYLLNMEGDCFDTSDRSTDGGSLARCLSSWQGWDAPGRGAEAPSTPCLLWKRPSFAFQSAWVKCTHPSQPLPCFLRGYPAVFCCHFSPPTRGRQSGMALL